MAAALEVGHVQPSADGGDTAFVTACSFEDGEEETVGAHESGGFDFDVYRKNLRNEEVEKWRSGEAQEDVASERRWECILPAGGQKAQSATCLSRFGVDMATWKQRNALDESEAHRQEFWPIA